MASTNPTTATNINNNNLAANKGKDKGRGKGKKGKKPAAPSDAPVSTLPNAASTSTVPDGAKRKADATLEREENKKLKDFIAKGGPELAAFTKLKGVEMPNLTDKNDGDGDATVCCPSCSA